MYNMVGNMDIIWNLDKKFDKFFSLLLYYIITGDSEQVEIGNLKIIVFHMVKGEIASSLNKMELLFNKWFMYYFIQWFIKWNLFWIYNGYTI